jgi:hypothetical protein
MVLLVEDLMREEVALKRISYKELKVKIFLVLI